MFITIDAESPTPVYKQIVSQLRAAIAGGELSPGDPLPTVRQLAGDLGVNFNTVANAYRALADEGLVETHQGRGARVISRAKSEANEPEAKAALERFLSEMMLAGRSKREIVELVEQALESMGARSDATVGGEGT